LAGRSRNLYENEAFKTVTGPNIRPGGLALTDRALSHCKLPAQAAILDAGCGRGATAAHLARAHRLRTVGLDLSPRLLEEGRRRHPSQPFVRADAAALPFRRRAFAAVLCECVLSLTPDPGRVLGEFQRILDPGGVLLLSDLYLRCGDGGASTHPPTKDAACCLAGAVTKEKTLARLSAAGFGLIAWEDHSPLLGQLAARLVFAYGSLAAFWQRVYGDTRSRPWCTAADGGRPGYFLLVARKESFDG
jgi:ubiquinone/menaquinone biosynthesis C-methylase UbiE